MSDATKCDRCGACYEYGGMTVGEEYDLCDGCVADFEAWMECGQMADTSERVTNQAETSHDTREKLEADVCNYLDYPNNCRAVYDVEAVKGWLDRQAAITERETLHSHPICAGSDACPALNRPIGESADRETPDTAGIGASKDEIRDFDVWNVAYEIYCAGGYVDNGNEPNPPTDGIRELLDRQAAITERELVSQGVFDLGMQLRITEQDKRIVEYAERTTELEREIATLKEHRAANMEKLHELTDECAELRKYRDEWKGIAEAAWAECEGYRAKLGDVLDAIHKAERAAR